MVPPFLTLTDEMTFNGEEGRQGRSPSGRMLLCARLGTTTTVPRTEERRWKPEKRHSPRSGAGYLWAYGLWVLDAVKHGYRLKTHMGVLPEAPDVKRRPQKSLCGDKLYWAWSDEWKPGQPGVHEILLSSAFFLPQSGMEARGA